MRSGRGLLVLPLGAPIKEVGGVQSDAKKIGGHETELRSSDTDHAHDGAIKRGYNPALPQLLTEEDGAQDGQNAGEIIESNHVKHIEHFGLVGRSRNLSNQSTGALGFPVLLRKIISPSGWVMTYFRGHGRRALG